MIFFEADKLKNLSNIELINKRQELEEQLSSVKKNIVSSDILNSMNMILEYYTNEIDVRIALGTLDSINDLENNLTENDIPLTVMQQDYTSYKTFLQQRRQLISQRIKHYYQNL